MFNLLLRKDFYSLTKEFRINEYVIIYKDLKKKNQWMIQRKKTFLKILMILQPPRYYVYPTVHR